MITNAQSLSIWNCTYSWMITKYYVRQKDERFLPAHSYDENGAKNVLPSHSDNGSHVRTHWPIFEFSLSKELSVVRTTQLVWFLNNYREVKLSTMRFYIILSSCFHYHYWNWLAYSEYDVYFRVSFCITYLNIVWIAKANVCTNFMFISSSEKWGIGMYRAGSESKFPIFL